MSESRWGVEFWLIAVGGSRVGVLIAAPEGCDSVCDYELHYCAMRDGAGIAGVESSLYIVLHVTLDHMRKRETAGSGEGIQ